MAFTDILKNVSADKIVDLLRPYIPVAWTQTFSGYGTYAIGVLMILSGAVSLFGVPLPWVPLGSEGQWIAGGFAAFTVRRAIANNHEATLAAIQENTDLTKTVVDATADATISIKKTTK